MRGDDDSNAATRKDSVSRCPRRQKQSGWVAVLGLVLFLTVACGYHTAGHMNTLPRNIKVLAVPGFVNQSQTFRIEQSLTQAVVHELTTRTQYQIVNRPSDVADATLQGTVLTTSASPLTYDSKTGRAESVLVVVSMKVSLVDRDGKMFLRVRRHMNAEKALREDPEAIDPDRAGQA